MAFYFRCSDANDLCYRAAIGRDECRGLPDPESSRRAAERSTDAHASNPMSASSAAASPPPCSRKNSRELRPGLSITVVEAGKQTLRPRKPHAVPPAQHRVRRESLARRLHRGPGGQRRHLPHHGRRRFGAALGRHLQSLLRGRPAPEIDVRPATSIGPSSGRSWRSSIARPSGAWASPASRARCPKTGAPSRTPCPPWR